MGVCKGSIMLPHRAEVLHLDGFLRGAWFHAEATYPLAWALQRSNQWPNIRKQYALWAEGE